MGNREWDDAPDDSISTGFEEDSHAREISGHHDLDVWKLAMDLAVEIYALTAKFPQEEKYGLSSQLRRATVSISANIAEGYGRETTGAYIQFLRIAQGSTREMQSLLELSKRLDFVKHDSAKQVNAVAIRVSKMLRALIRSLEYGPKRR